MAAEPSPGGSGGDSARDRQRLGVDELVGQLLDPQGPLGRMALASLKQVVEFHILFLTAYRGALAESRVVHTAEQHLRETIRAMLSAYVKVAESFPKRGEELVQAHAATIDACVKALEDIRRRIEEKSA
jgi:hypothetical protein